MKQGSSSDRYLPFTFSAEKETTPHQRWLLGTESAIGTSKTFGPAKFRNIVKASTFAAKPFIKLLESSRIINAGNGVP